MSEELEQEVPVVEEVKTEEPKPVSVDDGVIKVDLGLLNKPVDDAIPEQETNEVDVDQQTSVSEEVVEEVPQQQEPVQSEEPVLEEITNEEVAEQVEEAIENLEEELDEAIDNKVDNGVDLPENIQKVVDFMNETGGSLQDYVKLNTDYASLNETQLLREFYETTKPHLDREEIDFIMQDNFSYDEEVDEDRDIRRKKLARKEELAKAKKHLDGLKSKYYEEIKAGSRMDPETKKAVDFFNRYKKENEEASKITESQVSVFKSRTEKLFSDDFKGFDFNVGEKKFRYKVKNADQVKDTQGDINNFVKKFLNDKNEMNDAAGYHKSLFTAMNADAIANHFYEQGKTDAMKASVQKAKNIDMDPRGVHEEIKNTSGMSFKSIGSTKASKFGIKTRK